jgi:glucose-6-phosphate 1-epimerase
MTDKLLNNDFAQVTYCPLTQEGNIEPLEGVNISHPHCHALVSLHGGQVLRFKPNGHKDILWLSDSSHYKSGKAIRGGIPICWPWFGVNDKQTADKKVGNHGFARQLSWHLESVDADENGVTLVLVLEGDNQHPLWPYAYHLKQTLFFGEHFKQRLTMTNLSEEDAQYSAALHSYFTVSHPKNITIDTLTGVTFNDKLSGELAVENKTVNCVGEVDRVYHSQEKMVMTDAHWQRKVEVSSHNCQQWVLWNPGTVLANTMTDIHAEGEHEYVCLEAANANWQKLSAGETVTISQEIKVINE